MNRSRPAAHPVLAMLAGLVLLTGLAAGGASPAAAAPYDDSGSTSEGTDTDYGRMLLVLDSSGSMKEDAGGGTTKIDAAKSALDEVVGNLPDDADVGLRVFGATVFSRKDEGACTDSQLVVDPGTDNRDALRKAVASYKPYGETPIAHALQEAAKDLGNEGTRSIVLVSDGIATCQPDPCDVAAKIAAAGIDLQIDVVGLGVDGKARAQLRCIADRGNGTYYDADSADDITSSLTKAADRAVKPYEFDGAPISGGPSQGQATEVSAGVWQDVLGRVGTPESERWYRYDRQEKESTLLVGSTLLGDKKVDASTIRVVTPDGENCETDSRGTVGVRQEVYAIGVTVGAGIGSYQPEGCLGGTVYIQMEHQDAGSFGKTPSRFSMRIAEEPKVSDVSGLPSGLDYMDGKVAPPSVGGAVREVQAGQSLGQATTLTDGRYTADIVPGESQIYRVKLDWGQQLSARMSVGEASEALRGSGLSGAYGNLQVLNPMGVGVPDDPEGVDAAIQLVPFAGSDSATTGTLPVRWATRQAGISTTYLAGYYYLVVNANPTVDGSSAEVPYTLEVQVQGEKAGAPTYDDDAKLLTTSKGASSDKAGQDVETKKVDPVSSPTDDDAMSTPVKLAAAGGLGAVALLCCALAVMLLRRAR